MNIIEPKLDYSQIIEKIQNSDYLKSKRDKKHESYKYAFQLIEEATQNKKLPFCIASIAITESIIADRCQSFLYFKEKVFMINQKDNFIRTGILVDKCNKHFPNFKIAINRRNSSTFKTDNLFSECSKWLKDRNDILHSFAKTSSKQKNLNLIEFTDLAVQTSIEGLRLVSLIKKWHQQEIMKSKKNK